MAKPRKKAVKNEVPETKETVAVKAAEETVEAPVETKEVVETPTESPAETKAVETVPEAAEEEKKSPAKKARKTTASTTTEKKTAEKKAPAKKQAEERRVVIQFAGNEVAGTDLVDRAKALSGVKSPKSVSVYVKPEENKAYYVVDDEITGDFDIF